MIDATIARRIRLVGIDVDGTMTDGGLYIGAVAARDGVVSRPMELKRYDIQDGLGIVLLRTAGLLTAIVTGRTGESARIRAEELGVDDFVADAAARKLAGFQRILARHGVGWEEAAFVGDDLPDLPILKRVGLPVAVANATAEVRGSAAFTTRLAGGHGAVREFVEALLTARGVWTDVVRTYLHERGDDTA